MSRIVKAIALLSLVILLAGCAVKKPVNYRFSACLVVNKYVDRDGNERLGCDCKNGKQIGWDAKEHLAIIRCE